MRHDLFPAEGTFYKANLHSHSNISDGHLTPVQMRDFYREHGYSVLAITDHEIMMDHTDLTLPDFQIINGYEIYLRERQDAGRIAKNCHINLIARTPDVIKQIAVDPKYLHYLDKNGLTVDDIPRVGELCDRHFCTRDINAIIRTAVENGYLVAYNHPSWSLETFEDFSKYEGVYAMEICNYGSSLEGFTDNDGWAYDQMLRLGKFIWCLANDDNHNAFPWGDPRCDSFGGFNMIKAKELSYAAIIEALEKGDFYASQGPEIHDLYVEDNRLHVKCSPAVNVLLRMMGRPGKRGGVYAPIGQTITEAEFELKKADGFFRVEVTDARGKKAFTHAYKTEGIVTE
ncbi:MAG: PHP domain-containing protein [Clostridia bacterium]|nr:PHP domain-containing protein [Clostridia bacterium]